MTIHSGESDGVQSLKGRSFMKQILLLIAILALPSGSFGEEKTVNHQAAEAADTIKRDSKDAAEATVKAVREAWRSTKAYLSEDPNEYRDGAMKKLAGFTGEIARLNADSRKESMADRTYFLTRVKALQEHLEYARAELAKLPVNKEQKDYAFARRHFDRTLETLEDAIDQARSEANDEG
jgi:hypothetical protein